MAPKPEQASQRSPYPFRIDPVVRERAQDEAARLDRSLNWILNHRLRESFGLEKLS